MVVRLLLVLDLGETGPLSQGVQAGRKALRIRHINGMEVRKKRPRGFKKEAQGVQVSPLNPLSVSPCLGPATHRRFSEECGVCSTSGGMPLGAGGVLLREVSASVREAISGDRMLGGAPRRNSRRFCPARKNRVVRRAAPGPAPIQTHPTGEVVWNGDWAREHPRAVRTDSRCSRSSIAWRWSAGFQEEESASAGDTTPRGSLRSTSDALASTTETSGAGWTGDANSCGGGYQLSIPSVFFICGRITDSACPATSVSNRADAVRTGRSGEVDSARASRETVAAISWASLALRSAASACSCSAFSIASITFLWAPWIASQLTSTTSQLLLACCRLDSFSAATAEAFCASATCACIRLV